jgi:hypothetical protein
MLVTLGGEVEVQVLGVVGPSCGARIGVARRLRLGGVVLRDPPGLLGNVSEQ